MAEEKKTQVIIDEEAIKDEESAYPGTTSSGLTKDQIRVMMEFRKEHELESKYPPFQYGYGHMSTDKIPIIPNPNANPQWSEIMDDAIKFAATISTEVDIEKIKAAVYKFIDVENSSGRFIRVAMANSILRSEVNRRIKSKNDSKKMLEDLKYTAAEIKEMINKTYGVPKKYNPHPENSFGSIYVDCEGEDAK